MKRLIVMNLLILLVLTYFANYAYFSRSGLLKKNESLTFVIYGENLDEEVVLTVREVRNDRVLVSKLLGETTIVQPYLGRVVLKKTYKFTGDWTTYSVKLDRLGIYYATLSTRNERGVEVMLDETFLVITDLIAFHFTDRKRTILCVVKQGGGFVADAEVFFYKDSKIVETTRTDPNGMAICESSCDFFYVRKENSYIFGEIFTPYAREYEDEKLFLLTDRPIYKPNDTVKMRGQLFKKDENVYEAFGASLLNLIIKDPKDNEVYRKDLTTDELGGFFDEFKLPDSAPLGVYEITVSHGERTHNSYFTVEEYRKPEYKISIEIPKETIFAGETLRFNISLKYFNDQPVANAQVAYYVYADPIEQDSFLAYRGLELTNEKGELTVEVKIEEEFEGYYRIEVVATDESQRQVEETKSVRVWADDVDIQLEKDYVWTSPGHPLRIPLTITNVAGEPLSGTLTVVVGDATHTVEVSNGRAEFVFVPEEPKRYRIEFIFKKAKKKLYVDAFARGYKPSELVLLAGQKSAQPGQAIQVNLASPNRITGLLTLLGDDIYEVVPVDTSELISMSLKIPENVAEKNLFVVFLGVEAGRYVEKQLKISVERKLNVSSLKISFDKERYEPGEFATIKIEADAKNACLMLVDEAIYAMVRRDPPDLEEFLYPENDYPGVFYDFAYTWRLYSRLESTYAVLAEKAVSFENFKKTAVMEKISVREYFPDTALWIPSLPLEDGMAVVRFKVPDSITTFRATAYGFARANFYQGSTSMVVTKPFYVRPILPSFFRENDVVQIGATIFNQTDEPLKTNYWIEFPDSVRPLQKTAIETILWPNSSHTESCFVQAIQPMDPSTLTFYAVSERTDAIALNVPVKPFAFEREYYFIGKIDGKRKFVLPDGQYLQAKLKVLTSVTPMLSRSIEKLIRYPYGCTEQTMSSFLPAIVATKMGLVVENLDEIVQKGLFKLYDHQHSDGGWGWWKTDESRPLMSAYVMEGLHYAIEAGYHVPESVIQSGIEYLKNNITGYGVYVLSLYGESVEGFEPKNEVDIIFSSMVSAESLQRAINLVKETETLAYVQIDHDDDFVSEVQLSSVLLRALLKWQKDSPLVPKLVNYLLSKKDGYFWYSTKDTSYAVLALFEALPSYDRPKVVIRNNGRNFSLDTEGELSLEKGSLEVEGEGLVEVHVVYLERPTAEVSKGIRIERQIYKRYELYLEEDEQIIDAFIPIDSNLVPVSIKHGKASVETLVLYPYQYNKPKDFERGKVTFSVFGNTLNLLDMKFQFEKLILGSELIVAELEGESALICDVKTGKTVIHQDVKDVALLGNGVLLLKKDNTLWLNDTLLTIAPRDVKGLSCTEKEIILRAERKSYWLKDKEFIELPFVARDVYEWDGENLVASDVRFSGNDFAVGDDVLHIVFKPESMKLRAGDIAKTVLEISEHGEVQYLVVEDFFACCAQVLTNYREKNLGFESKFEYGWYRTWDRWYSAQELHEDRIVFFASYCSNDTFGYVWRVTADGIYNLLPARAYSMYKQVVYAHSDPTVLYIGVDGESLAGR